MAAKKSMNESHVESGVRMNLRILHLFSQTTELNLHLLWRLLHSKSQLMYIFLKPLRKSCNAAAMLEFEQFVRISRACLVLFSEKSTFLNKVVNFWRPVFTLDDFNVSSIKAANHSHLKVFGVKCHGY